MATGGHNCRQSGIIFGRTQGTPQASFKKIQPVVWEMQKEIVTVLNKGQLAI